MSARPGRTGGALFGLLGRIVPVLIANAPAIVAVLAAVRKPKPPAT